MPSPKECACIRNRLYIWIVLLIIFSFHAADLSVAQDTAKSEDAPPQETQIEITADKLISNSEEKYAEFIGNVRASQGAFVMTSGKLRIYYEGDLVNPDSKDSDSGQDALKKIVATENVKIVSERYTATSDYAEYEVVEGTITLSGKKAKVVSGKNSLAGTKIILNQKTGQVKVEGGPKQRVKAIFYSEGGADNPFQIGTPEGGKKE